MTRAKNRFGEFFALHGQLFALAVLLVVMGLIFTYLTDGHFLAPRNLSNLFRQMAVISFLSVGMVLVIVSGNIDLSVGSVAGFTGAVAAMVQVDWLAPLLAEQVPAWDPAIQDLVLTAAALIAALVCGAGIGLFQGICVAYGGVPSFIVTLGGMLIFRGAILGITGGATLAPMSPSFQSIGQSYLSAGWGWSLAGLLAAIYLAREIKNRYKRIQYGIAPPSIPRLAMRVGLFGAGLFGLAAVMNLYLGVPYPLLFLGLIVFMTDYLARHTLIGRHIFAIGGNREAARLSGIDIRRRVTQAFVVMGVLAALSGIVLTARLNAATAKAGEMYELSAIAACVIGGTSLMGGKGSVAGAIFGGLVMAGLDNGMSLMNVEIYWQQMVKGLVLVLAVWCDLALRRKRAS